MYSAMRILAPLFLSLCLIVNFLGLVSGLIQRSPSQCNVSSASSVLRSLSTGSAFCSSFLYPSKPSTATTTTLVTSTKTCKTKTITTTVTNDKSKTVTKTVTTTLPSIAKYEYSSTVLVPNGSHQSVNKRQPQSAATSTTSEAVASANAVNAANAQQCSPTPSGLCSCSSGTISAACSSIVPSPIPKTSTVTSTVTTGCKVDVTVTMTTKPNVSITTYTLEVSPPPDIISKTGVLTTTVPVACAGPTYDSGGTVGEGNIIMPVAYPVFAQTGVECCVACYDSDYPNCVASAFIESGLDCQLLIKVNATAGASTKAKCPLGTEDYPFGQPNSDGNIYPGPCGY